MKPTVMSFMLLTAFPVFSMSPMVEDNAAFQIPDTVQLQEINVTALKNGGNLGNQPQSFTHVGRKEIEDLNIVALKGISDVVPNFYIPDYGSRITSSIYVRGIGARMDQPAVGLNVDNVPFLNKDAYDFDIADIVGIDMIRGPQSTLYGRNTMGGVINITTLSPLDYQGLRIVAEGGNGSYFKGNAGYYAKPGKNTGIAVSGGYTSTGGFFINEYNGEKLDKERQWQGRLRVDHRFSNRLKLQNVLSLSDLHQGGYAYESVATCRIEHNDTCFYRRFLLTDGLTLTWRAPGFTMTSISSLQYLNDDMTLDQDFLPLDYFTLTQKKKETAVTEDLVFRGYKDSYSWLGGLFAFYKHLDMSAPVTFKDTGISALIEEHRNQANADYPIRWDERSFPLNSDFEIATYGLAAYHQSKLDLGSWHFTAGLRLDYERADMNYLSRCATSYTVYHPYPVAESNVPININESGNLMKDFLELLPSVGAVWDIDGSGSNVYANISKGYKAGGFNTQMFSDVLQQRLMNMMGVGKRYSVADIVEYKPEKSWNYEVGSHLNFPDAAIAAEVSLFYIDCRDQQLTMFPEGNTTGRIMTNAGKTRSFGGEAQISWHPCSRLTLTGSYGYTNARFRKFFNGKSDYAGKYLPYAPMNTLFLQGVWRQRVRTAWLESVTFDVNMRGVGRIYWNEENSLWEDFYVLLGGGITFEGPHYSLQLWGRNLTDTSYHTFYFVSIGNEFVQRGRPLTFGATLRVDI